MPKPPFIHIGRFGLRVTSYGERDGPLREWTDSVNGDSEKEYYLNGKKVPRINWRTIIDLKDLGLEFIEWKKTAPDIPPKPEPKLTLVEDA